MVGFSRHTFERCLEYGQRLFQFRVADGQRRDEADDVPGRSAVDDDQSALQAFLQKPLAGPACGCAVVLHQLPERSFHLAGEQFAVCTRCTRLYAGFALATLSYPLFRSLRNTDTPRIVWLFASALPLAINFSLTYFGVWQNNHFTRFTTGALFGAVAAIFILPGVIEVAAYVTRLFRGA